MTDPASVTPAAILRGARDLLSDPARWCRGALAKDARGRTVGTANPLAVQWCLIGACMRSEAMLDTVDGRVTPAWQAAAQALGFATRTSSPALVNDHGDGSATHHARVLEALDDAIVIAEGAVNGPAG